MSLLRLPIPFDLQTELSTTQVPIALGASGAFSTSGNINTITFTSAHGLTFSPSAGVLPNLYVTFNTVSGQTGTGTLNSNIFRVLAIPSTTTIQIYSTITAATMTSANCVPVFVPNFTERTNSAFAVGEASAFSATPLANLQAVLALCTMGANCNAYVNPDGTALLLDQQTTPSTGTPGTSPTWRKKLAASTSGDIWLSPPWGVIWADGSAGTSYISCIN